MKVIFIGDSTMQENDYVTYPQVGWPQALPLFFKKELMINNFAHNGCSTKSFQDLGYFDKALETTDKGDYVIIQFGHNDAKIDNPLRYTDPYTTYQDNLRTFITKFREKGAIPILLTSIYRRYFEEDGKVKPNCHLNYPQAMLDLGEVMDVTTIDMCGLTKNRLDELGDERSKRLFMYFDEGIYDNYLLGLHDNTHLRYDGAYEVALLFVKALKKLHHPLAEYFKEVKNE